MPKDLTFQAIKLLSQYIVSSKEIPEGRILQKTSCMNPEDAEMIGLIEASKVFLKKNPKNAKLIERLNEVQDFFEILGLSKRSKGELTHLGFRAGTRYEEQISATYIDEASIIADSRE